jgi:hypothetical protein
MGSAIIRVWDLHREAQLALDMDSECVVKGNGHSAFAVKQTIEEMCEILGIGLPVDMTRAEREKYLIDNDRECDIEYLGAMGD